MAGIGGEVGTGAVGGVGVGAEPAKVDNDADDL